MFMIIVAISVFFNDLKTMEDKSFSHLRPSVTTIINNAYAMRLYLFISDKLVKNQEE